MNPSASRRSFLQNIGLGSLGAVAAGALPSLAAVPTAGAKILGESGVKTSARPKGVWKAVSERKIRVGIVGYGVCKFGAQFGFQDHPNVTVAAVSDLFPTAAASWLECADVGKRILRWKNWSRTTRWKPSSWRPTRPATPGTASRR